MVEIHAIIETNFGIFFPSQQLCDHILSWMTEIWMKIHLVSDSIYNIVNYHTGVLQLVFSKSK